ncbi:hypothetical protein AJ80_05327 [Polytolypa hystricis UAMH7299]|uniref:Tail specific protease domain-containing protein n=1 Tax=Polytolypa hystricis (strain UAMH7299) TaxID=1447883 RepID=A0A2B7Y5F7_POLH7|nr:hypothetical protein AJ80_05327 [Polytolypa hystricis UAMH7299]
MRALSRVVVSLTLLTSTAWGLGNNFPTRAKVEPCEEVRIAQEEQFSAEPETTIFTVSAELAEKCLQSVPIKKKDALRLVDSISSFWKWQSSLDYLTDPPKGYLLPAVDLIGGLKEIRRNVAKGKYKGEAEFQRALYHLATDAHDGHLDLPLDAISTFFYKRVEIGGLVSVSADGKSLPEIYVQYDLKAAASAELDWTPSAVDRINGKDAVQWLREYSYNDKSHDPDALYNNMFYSIPARTKGFLGGFAHQHAIYTGKTTTIEFKNDTKVTFENIATFTESFEGVNDGKSFYAKFCNATLTTEPNSSAKKRNVVQAAPITQSRAVKDPRALYPDAVYFLSNGDVAGYFLDGEFSDTAVLSVLAFISTYQDGISEAFSELVVRFLAACRKNGKKKLIIDVATNPGGKVFVGFDLFKQLFPNAEIKNRFNFRAHEQYEVLGDKINDLLTDDKLTIADIEQADGLFDPDVYTRADGKKFSSWKEWYGPDTVHGYKFTRPARWDLENPGLTKGGNLMVSGYQDRLDVASQPFDAENIVLLTDGACASTCTILASLLKQQGVRSVVMGGRPRDSPMQAIGGVEGSMVLTLEDLYTIIKPVFDKYITGNELRRLEDTDLGELYRSAPYLMGRTSIDGAANVNYQNALHPDDDTLTPTQFVYEPADCRLFYTQEMMFDISAVWTAAANVAWGGGECVSGSASGAF